MVGSSSSAGPGGWRAIGVGRGVAGADRRAAGKMPCRGNSVCDGGGERPVSNGDSEAGDAVANEGWDGRKVAGIQGAANGRRGDRDARARVVRAQTTDDIAGGPGADDCSAGSESRGRERREV